jgi:hypothetical protein
LINAQVADAPRTIGKSRNRRRVPFVIVHLSFDIGHRRRRSRINAQCSSGDVRTNDK